MSIVLGPKDFFGLAIRMIEKASKMRADMPTDYETYREIMHDLLTPICSDDLDDDTLKRLYESKLVYLENLRTKCFQEMNSSSKQGYFSVEDYKLILQAISQTNSHLRHLIINALNSSLRTRKVR